MTAENPIQTVLDSKPVLGRCRLCDVEFLKARAFMNFCTAEHRRIWNQNHYCGHGRRYEACEVAGCEGRALFDTLASLPFTRCACGIWFARKARKKHCCVDCRYVAKHEAEKARKRAA